ncbi:MAG: hypothetical protein NC115_03475 [Bacteroidales bacterium]|nr:hypothetical protein [Bacteroides sp.]MCM1197802.1 hypothetical protein [Clostridium sp.]MCM1501713.1 hypothetical protein [Bacteroidales bacterium]
MKKIILMLVSACLAATAFAQISLENEAASEKYSQRYDVLVSKLGPAGVGIENLLENWEKIDPDNRKLVLAKYSYYLTKAQSTAIVTRPGKKYLGNEPLFSLKDSTGNNVNYFEETNYDDSLYSVALKNIDRAIRLFPLEMDIKFMKAASLVSYEKESPDMALAFLENLADEYYSGQARPWKFGGDDMDEEFFQGAIQEYCYVFYNIASPSSYEAFRALSQKMLDKRPKSTVFLSNMGSYYLIAQKDPKMALKYYNKVLKIKPDDYTAAKNCVLLSRRQKNVKMEKKYLPVLIACSPDEAEVMSAKARLEVLK